jgi:hypothetical protein
MEVNAETRNQDKLRRRKTITLSSLVSVMTIVGGVLPLLAILLRPWFIQVVTEAVADEVSDQIKKEIAPANAGLKVLIETQIAELEDEISRLEYKMQRLSTDWSALDAQDLTLKRRRLASQKKALLAIELAESRK